MADITLHLTRQALQGKRLPSTLVAKQVYLLVQNGLSWEDVPAVMRGCVWLERYAEEVANGGHSQFIGNANNHTEDGARRGLAWAIEGANIIGATPLAELAQECLDWINTHPEEAVDQTGATGGNAAALKPLDAQYFKLDRGDAVAFRAALAKADDAIAANLAHIIGVGSENIIRYTPLHTVAMQLALLTVQPVKIVSPREMEAAVLAQLDGSGAAELGRLKALRGDIAFSLPGPWFCAVLLAVADTHPPGTPVEVWGDDKLAKSRPHMTYGGVLRMESAPPRKITLNEGIVTVHAPDQPRGPVLVERLSHVPPVTGFFAKRRQAREIARQIKAENDRRIAEHAEKSRTISSEVSVPLAEGKALYDAWRAMHLTEALMLFKDAHQLPGIGAMSLLRAVTGDAPRVEWQVWFGMGKPRTATHVIQTPASVVLRFEDADTVTRYDTETLQKLAAQTGG